MRNKKTQVICIANQKGGVAKTTTAAYLGAALARLNRRVLLVDSDPQCNLSYSMELEEAQQEFVLENNLASIYESGQDADTCTLRLRDNLSLIAASPDLVMTEVTLDSNPETLAEEPEKSLRNALDPVTNKYDYIIAGK